MENENTDGNWRPFLTFHLPNFAKSLTHFSFGIWLSLSGQFVTKPHPMFSVGNGKIRLEMVAHEDSSLALSLLLKETLIWSSKFDTQNSWFHLAFNCTIDEVFHLEIFLDGAQLRTETINLRSGNDSADFLQIFQLGSGKFHKP